MPDSFIRRKPIIAYFLLVFLASWTLWSLSILFGKTLPFAATYTLTILAGSAPSVTGVLLTRYLGGRPAISALWKRVKAWRVGAGWYLFVLFFPPALIMGALGLHVALGGTMPAFEMLARYGLLLPVLFLQVFLLGGPLEEELGWRGFALPRLQERFGLLGGNVVLGGLWAVWHLPLFWISISNHSSIPLFWYLLQVVAFSLILGWMYNRTGGNLLLPLLLHTTLNVSTSLLPVLPTYAGSTRPLILGVVVLAATAATLWLLPVRADQTTGAKRSA